MSRLAVVTALASGLLAGCVTEQNERLSMACQVSKCDCVSSTLVFFGSKPVEWLSDGRASCPEGYNLRKLSSP